MDSTFEYGSLVDSDGNETWYLDGKLHRLDGPAFIFPSGTQHWYQHGELHRVDGPAMILHDGSQHWYLNNKRHKLNGPAVITSNGLFEFWAYGVEYNSLEELNIGVILDQ